MSDRSDPEIVAEQAYLDAVYDRLDAMRESAERVAAVYGDVRQGGTHQARLERDIAVETTHRRLAALDIGDTPLCFGRIDRTDDSQFYVGRLAVDDEDRTPLVIDWRAPVAEPFYRATALEPMGVLRRRHLLTRHGREVIGLDDEVFDTDAVEAAGLTVLGEGALLAALERNRTGRMADIVATIQAEQDSAVRAELPGVLVVAGGPGTGKTAVALHRAAYLLYTFRQRLGNQGVLLVGPSTVFLRYIEQVLPSLGEHEVQLATVSGLKPQLNARRVDAPAVAAIKARASMATVLRRALADRERPPRHD
ncbi:MAG: HelD family protein, partial [Acidimicrobiia bacterium]